VNKSSHLHYASLPHKAIALQSRAAARAVYICPYQFTAGTIHQAKSKRPLPLRTRLYVLPRFRPKLGGD
jgi:hypothetical protein